MTISEVHPSKAKLLEAARDVIRAKGYAATRIEDVCAAAGVTKGSFFHHFDGKDDLAVAAADWWSSTTGALFAAAPYHAPADPLDRLLAYVDFRRALIDGGPADFSCLAGTMVQETFQTAPAIRAACGRAILGHAATLEADIEAARRARGIQGDWSARSLARHMQGVLQGAFILAKATGDADAARESIDHLRRYVALLFETPGRTGAAG